MKSADEKVFIEDSSILSVHGLGLDKNFSSLYSGKSSFSKIDFKNWPDKVKQLLEESSHNPGGSQLELSGDAFSKTTSGIKEILKTVSGLKTTKSLGVVLASTKFHHEDFIWSGADPKLEIERLTHWVKKEVYADKVHFISNACTSGLVGLKFAKTLIEKSIYDKVLVLSYDLMGPFVYSGFLSLGAISPEISKPFSKNRKGLHLGEAFAGVLLSKEGEAHLKSVEFMNDGESAIRPTYAVEILPKLYEKMNISKIDGVLAHGTGTKYNDMAEMKALEARFSKAGYFVTGSKWSLGHSLGASALIDVALASKALKEQKIFGISYPKEEVEEDFKSRVLTDSKTVNMSNLLIQSLGFGGVTGAAELEAL